MKNMVRGLDHNANSPVAPHAQIVASCAKLAIGIGMQHKRIGAHSHILHRRIKRDLHSTGWARGTIVQHTGRKDIDAGMIGCNVECNAKGMIEGLCCAMKRRIDRRGLRWWLQCARIRRGYATACKQKTEQYAPGPFSVEQRYASMYRFLLSIHNKTLWHQTERRCL